MSNNDNLHAALKNKNDEFYTLFQDIALECDHYIPLFEGKNILLPCDNVKSNFWLYFYKHFNEYKIQSLTATSLGETKGQCIFTNDGINIINKELYDNGDFQSQEIQDIININDIIITNPPFSLFRKLVMILEKYHKQYLLIGNENTLASTEIFPLIKDEKLHLGFNKVKDFLTPDNSIQTFGNISWFTNLPIEKEIKPIKMTCTYDPKIYLSYDNFKAINVDKVTAIPSDYYEVMGVPITYLNKHNKNQFKIMGLAAGNTKNNGLNFDVEYTPSPLDRGGCGVVNGVRKYSRVFIKRKDNK